MVNFTLHKDFYLIPWTSEEVYAKISILQNPKDPSKNTQDQLGSQQYSSSQV